MDPSTGPRAVFVDAKGDTVYQCNQWQVNAASGATVVRLKVPGKVPASATKVTLFFDAKQFYGKADTAIKTIHPDYVEIQVNG